MQKSNNRSSPILAWGNKQTYVLVLFTMFFLSRKAHFPTNLSTRSSTARSWVLPTLWNSSVVKMVVRIFESLPF